MFNSISLATWKSKSKMKSDWLSSLFLDSIQIAAALFQFTWLKAIAETIVREVIEEAEKRNETAPEYEINESTYEVCEENGIGSVNDLAHQSLAEMNLDDSTGLGNTVLNQTQSGEKEDKVTTHNKCVDGVIFPPLKEIMTDRPTRLFNLPTNMRSLHFQQCW